MLRKQEALGALLFCSLFAWAAPAVAHCCHDEREVATFEESGLRAGLHGMDGGLTDEPIQRNHPTIGNGLRGGGADRLGTPDNGGLGQMQGDSLGSYGAGSVGEPGPGGLGALRGENIGVPGPRPR